MSQRPRQQGRSLPLQVGSCTSDLCYLIRIDARSETSAGLYYPGKPSQPFQITPTTWSAPPPGRRWPARSPTCDHRWPGCDRRSQGGRCLIVVCLSHSLPSLSNFSRRLPASQWPWAAASFRGHDRRPGDLRQLPPLPLRRRACSGTCRSRWSSPRFARRTLSSLLRCLSLPAIPCAIPQQAT